MSYLDRKLVCERLRVHLRTSYRIIGASHTSLISSSELLEIINGARRGIREPFLTIPSDLRTPEEMAEELGGCVSASKLLRWSHRRNVRIPPHFRFNKQTTRFSSRLMNDWMREHSKSRKPC